jgi:hypothetical protein
MNSTSRYLLTIAAAAALAVTVKADPILSSSYPVLTLSDGGSGPNDTATITAAGSNGTYSFNGSLGGVSDPFGDWTIAIAIGTSGTSTADPFIDLDIVAAGVGTLQIDFTDAFTTALPGSYSANIGGTLGSESSLLNTVYQSTTGGSILGQQSLLFTNPSSSSIPVSFGGPGAAVGGNYATGSTLLTEEIVLSDANGSLTSADASWATPDQGMSVVLLGSGLLALGLFARFGMRKSAV